MYLYLSTLSNYLTIHIYVTRFENPDNYWHTLEDRFLESSEAIATHLLKNKASSKDIYVVDNLTVAFSILSHSLIAHIKTQNSVILIQTHTYSAVKIATIAACKNAPINHCLSGNELIPISTQYDGYIHIAVGYLTLIEVCIPFPICDPDTHDSTIIAAYTHTLECISTKWPDLVIELAIIDHITSVPSIRMPVEELIPVLRNSCVTVKEVCV